MIPKLLHQTSKTAEIPAACRAYQQKLRALHPDWQYRLWTDQDNLDFVKHEFPDMLDVYVKMPKNIMRADVIRYFLMYRLGGLYMDLDFEMLRPFEFLQHDIVLPWEVDEVRVANSIMAAAPGHPYFKMVLDDLKANPPLSPDVNVLEATGPAFLSRILRKAKQENIEVFSPSWEILAPTTPRSPRQYRKIIKGGVAHGIHHCHGTWIQYTWPRRVRNRIAAIVKWFM